MRLTICAVNAGQTVRKSDIARACNASENHLGVVVNMLGHAGFLETARGRHGGLRLARSAQDIRVGDVFRTFETTDALAECFAAADNRCPLSACCRLQGKLAGAVDAFYAALDGVTLAELVEDNTGLLQLLELENA